MRSMGAVRTLAWITTAAPFAMLAACDSGFTDADLDTMKKEIRKEFEKRENVSVTDVVMLRESSTKAVGYAKLRVPFFGEVTKACSATMAESRQYIWRCE